MILPRYEATHLSHARPCRYMVIQNQIMPEMTIFNVKTGVDKQTMKLHKRNHSARLCHDQTSTVGDDVAVRKYRSFHEHNTPKLWEQLPSKAVL